MAVLVRPLLICTPPMLPARLLLIAGAATLLVGASLSFRPVRAFLGLVAEGDSRELPGRRANTPSVPPGAPSALVLALDGVNRGLLYGMLERGELPHLGGLLGRREGGRFLNAHLDDRILSPLPSSTLSAWATAFTGEPPGVHGVAGNEYFVREQRRVAAPAPVSFLDPAPVIETYTDDYANRLLRVPTVYQLLRARDEAVTSWVSMSQFYAGADRLLLANRTVIADAFKALVSHTSEDGDGLRLFEQLDEEAVENVVEELAEHDAPRLLTVYLTGTDHYAHVAKGGPDSARARYLAQVADPLIGELVEALHVLGAMENRTTLVISDHGHTEVLHDEAHALGTDQAGEPPSVLEQAGFRVRGTKLQVDDDDPFSAVVAYGGALAYVYLADRGTCQRANGPCDWSRPPRPEDVEAAAEAFHLAARDPRHPMFATLDLILAPRNAARTQNDALVAYLGEGRWEDLAEHLRAVPRRSYVDAAERFDELVHGPAGSNAGDLILVARNGNEERVEDRYYFAGLYRSWHGSPSRQDSEVPFIVSHPNRTPEQLRAQVDRAIEGGHTLAATTRLLLDLFGATK
jgi:hypothetical protein